MTGVSMKFAGLPLDIEARSESDQFAGRDGSAQALAAQSPPEELISGQQ